MDGQTDGQTDIWSSRVEFATENLQVHNILFKGLLVFRPLNAATTFNI